MHFNSRSAATDKKKAKSEPRIPKSEPRIPQNDLTEENDFVKNEAVTSKFTDTEIREVNPEENNSQINPSTETHNETVKEELFETPVGGSTRESITAHTNNKSRSKQRYLHPK